MSTFRVSFEQAKLVDRGVKTVHVLPVEKIPTGTLGKSKRGRWCPQVADSVLVAGGEWAQPEQEDAKPVWTVRLSVRVEVFERQRKRLDAVTEDEAKAAGFDDLDGFFADWKDTTRQSVDYTELMGYEVWVLRLKKDERRFPAGKVGVTAAPIESDEARGYSSTDELAMGQSVSQIEQREQTNHAWGEWAKTENVLMRRSIRERDQRRRQQGVRLEEAKRKLRLQGKDFSSKERAAERVIRDLERLADENGNQEAA